jgi:hypothetical protein
MTVKDRLETLRKIFAEDEMNQQVTRIQQAWEQQDSQLAANSLFRPGPANHEPFVDNGQEDLHTFLVKKIKNI